jgi:hypothetical protein
MSSVTRMRSGITFPLFGQASTTVGVSVARPRTGWRGCASDSSLSARRTCGRRWLALHPRSGALACAARPWISTASSAWPRWPVHTSRSVASARITAPGRPPRVSIMCIIPHPPFSS